LNKRKTKEKKTFSTKHISPLPFAHCLLAVRVICPPIAPRKSPKKHFYFFSRKKKKEKKSFRDVSERQRERKSKSKSKKAEMKKKQTAKSSTLLGQNNLLHGKKQFSSQTTLSLSHSH
jgi:hypothetical protein